MTYNRDEILEHYGVPGMKWGVRKDRSSRAAKKAAKSAPKEMSDDAKKAAATQAKAKAKSVSALSNQEIQQYTQRVNLERQYASLQPLSGAAKAQKVVKDILGYGNTVNQAMNFAKSPAGAALDASFGSGYQPRYAK